MKIKKVQFILDKTKFKYKAICKNCRTFYLSLYHSTTLSRRFVPRLYLLYHAVFVTVIILASVCHTSFLTEAHAYGRNQVGTSGAQFLKLGVNARAIGMGEAYSAVVDGADAMFWNPAALARIQNRSLSFMHAVYLENIYYDFGSYAQKVRQDIAVGAAVQYLNAGSIDQTDDFGRTFGNVTPYDMAVSVGLAKSAKGLDSEEEGSFLYGISAKFIQSRLIETASSGALDFGAVWHPLKQVRASFVVQNVGTELKFKNESDPLPFNVKLGSAYEITDSWLAALDANFPRDSNPYAAAGTEYSVMLSSDFWLSGRAGYNSINTADLNGLSSLSVGTGFGWRFYALDFAWVPFGSLGYTYRVSLSIELP